ncbi:GNAT family N-acetyltransferase [Streptococcus sp. H31]|uniref:GNAT family N-acetyltransferase n=1 Tax=Streptococcus huangxiaojuni TaxID=3237239 RepID=UPI0034A1634F
MQLRRPNQADKEAVLDLMTEFSQTGSVHDGGFWEADSFDYDNWLENNLQSEMGINIPEHFVPAIQFVSFDETGRALGFLHLRLRLNDYLLNQGGHIGYSIRPSERGKGYAKEQLRLGLKEAGKKNINPVLVTCHKTNDASQKIILANGGIYEDTREAVERFWIHL